MIRKISFPSCQTVGPAPWSLSGRKQAMGLEVTVLVVLLSRCSYMTEEREKERGGGWVSVEEVWWVKKRERNGRKTEVTGGWWRRGDEREENERVRKQEERDRGRDQDGCCGFKASAAAVASEMELEWTPLNILSRSYQRLGEMRYWQELLSALTAEQVNRVGRQATG